MIVSFLSAYFFTVHSGAGHYSLCCVRFLAWHLCVMASNKSVQWVAGTFLSLFKLALINF